MTDEVPVSILLQKSWRTPEGIELVKQIAASLNIQISSTGRSTISGRVPFDSFKKIFGVTPVRVSPRPPGEKDFGSAGGYAITGELSIPSELSKYVESISVVSPALRFH